MKKLEITIRQPLRTRYPFAPLISLNKKRRRITNNGSEVYHFPP